MDRRMKEAVRYLGYGKNTADERTLTMIGECFKELERSADPRSICRVFDMEMGEDGTVYAGNMTIKSKSLARNLKGCVKLVLFGATLGIGADQLIRRISVTEMSRALVCQACAAALLEEYCDRCQEEIAADLEREGLHVRPRFSPGYGDFDIHYQEPLMRLLDCPKKIGLTMTDSFMMTPTKSVTAVIGAGPFKERCPVAGCEACGKKDCVYRR